MDQLIGHCGYRWKGLTGGEQWLIRHSPDLPCQPCYDNQSSPRESPEADADIRASVLSDLLDRLANDQGNADSPTDLRQRISAYMARHLLDEMVTLYRRALSEARHS